MVEQINSGDVSRIAQQLSADALVTLFTLDLKPCGAPEEARYYRWTSGDLDTPNTLQKCANPTGLTGDTSGWIFAGTYPANVTGISAALPSNLRLEPWGALYMARNTVIDANQYMTAWYEIPGPIETLRRYEFQAILHCIRCEATIQLVAFNASGSIVGMTESALVPMTTLNEATSEEHYTRVYTTMVVPATATRVAGQIQAYGPDKGGNSQPYVIWSKVYLGPSATTDGTHPSPFALAAGSGKVTFGGNIYQPLPVEADGFEWRGRGAAPRPRIRVSNIGGILTSLVIEFNDLIGGELTRLRTFRRFLDGQPFADNESFFEPDIWRVERKVRHDHTMMEWELATILDQQGRMLPGRNAMRDVCGHDYRVVNAAGTGFDYTNASCPYVGGPSFTRTDAPTDDIRQDACSKRLTGCRLRFPSAPLPTRAFTGLDRYR